MKQNFHPGSMNRSKVTRRLFFRAAGATATALTFAPGTILNGKEAYPVPSPLRSMQQLPYASSPEILPDGQVIFRVSAPEATSVTLNGDYWIGRNVPMMRDSQGVWSVTIDPLDSGFYDYHFLINGVRTQDPGNVFTTRDGSRYSSSVRIPGPVGDDYQVNDVPHGTVHLVWYPSPFLDMNGRRMYVYTPACYESNGERYPVFYLLHGGGGDEDAWSNIGRAPQILDNLIARGKAKPMIVVMTNGNYNQRASQDVLTPPVSERGTQGPSPAFRRNILKFPQSLVQDVIPFIDKTFRTKSDRENRAIAGLSMGGAQTLYAGFNNLEKFAWIGEFSGSFPLLPDVAVPIDRPANADILRGPDITNTIDPGKFLALHPALNASVNEKLQLLYLSIGTIDGLITTHGELKDIMDRQGVHYELFEVPGFGHEWGFWRLTLRDFVPRLFGD